MPEVPVWRMILLMGVETVAAVIAIAISIASLIEAKRARRIAAKSHKTSFRSELQSIRRRWRHELVPILVQQRGDLTPDQYATLKELWDDAEVVSVEVSAALHRVHHFSAGLTAVAAAFPKSEEPRGRSAEVMKDEGLMSLSLHEAIREVEDALQRELKAHL